MGFLEHNGVVVATPKSNGQGSTYALTDAGRDLAGVVEDLAAWAERWVDVRTEHTDPGFALWVWCKVQLNRDALPDERVLVAFRFPDQRAGNRRFWLLVGSGDAEVCLTDPGGDPAVEVVARSRAFVDWHRGVLSWREAVRSGAITVHGRRGTCACCPPGTSASPTSSTPSRPERGRRPRSIAAPTAPERVGRRGGADPSTEQVDRSLALEHTLGVQPFSTAARRQARACTSPPITIDV